MTAGRTGGQRLRPHGDARPPHEQGAGALQRRALGDAALPFEQGGAASVRIRRCLPLRGKGASELARLILVCRGRKLFAERFALQEQSGRRAGGTESGQ